MTRQLLLGLTILSVSMSHLATAHHSRSNFSDDKITVEGVVVVYEWANPHVYFTVDVTSGSGEMQTWNIETHNTMVLVRRHGWSADTLKPGDSVVVNGRPDKNPDRLYIFGDWMIKKDTGERYAINGPGARSTSEPPRYTLEDDGNRLNVVTTNEDPEYLAETIAQEHDLRRTDATLVDYGECDPEIAQRYTRPN